MNLKRDLDQLYDAMEGSEASLKFSERHGVQSAPSFAISASRSSRRAPCVRQCPVAV